MNNDTAVSAIPVVSASAAASFLNHVLAAGALAVSELEAKARVAGLLGEHRQIQHAKAFKKAKKALGIQSIRNGFGSDGKWAWLMPPQAAQIAIASTVDAGPDITQQHSVRDAKPPDIPPAEAASRGIVQQ